MIPALDTEIRLLGEPNYNEWLQYGRRLSDCDKRLQWAIGDWLNYGKAKYERGRYDEGLKLFPQYEPQTLRLFSSVASRIDSLNRFNNLPWTHHQLVAPLEPDERAELLERAGAEGLSLSELRRVIRERRKLKSGEVEAAKGTYDAIVIDPPWPMQKIVREVAPNQTEHLDYPVMSEAELEELHIPAADDAHVWLWTTHRFLPMALRLLERWELKYVCTFVWNKPGGFQPFGLPQYNCEFALYARKGVPSFIDTKAFNVSFNAARRKHSEKPSEFYDVIARVTSGRRLDMFNRRPIPGFDGWGNEYEMNA